MRHESPPNQWIRKHITLGRFVKGIIGLLVLELVGGKYFPHQLSQGAFVLLAIWLPFMMTMIIWDFVWVLRHPSPPREQCPTCHQNLPENDNEQPADQNQNP
jgi:hypothetical protein